MLWPKPTSTTQPPGVPPAPKRWAATLIWCGLIVTLVAGVPIFLQQHLTSDAVLYDLQAKCVLSGGVLYRDIVEPNLPGVVWLHVLVRTLFGWSWAGLRAFDLVMLTGILVLLTTWIRRADEPRWGVRTALLCLGGVTFYLSQSEWCHCQRDLWMLLPALGALHLRAAAVIEQRQRQTKGIGRLSRFRPIFEGMLWGTAFWIKPHIAVPAVAVLTASCVLTGMNRRILYDWGGIFTGGLLVGAAGSLWLIESGTWPHFWEMQLQWNTEYLQAGRGIMPWSRIWTFYESFAPWSLLNIIGLIVSIIVIMRRPGDSPQTNSSQLQQHESDTAEIKLTLLCALYCGWLIQIIALQYPFAYVWMPTVVLALSITTSLSIVPAWRQTAWAFGTALIALAVCTSPLFRSDRLAAWGDCVRGSITPTVRAKIQEEIQPAWQDLGPVIDYLKTLQLKSGELTAYSGGLVHLYPELHLSPPTRYVYVDVLARVFRSHVEEIEQALQGSRQKYVVTSLREAGLPETEIDRLRRQECDLTDCIDQTRLTQFPFNQTLVFQSGQYVIHRIDSPVAPLCTDSAPLRRRRLQSVTNAGQADLTQR